MTTKKKWAIGIGVFLAFGLIGAIFDDNKNGTTEKEAEPQQIEQAEQNEEAERQAREQKKVEQTKAKQETKQEESICGTYEITDKVGCTIRLTINEDETATITGVNGEDIVYYCSWENFTNTAPAYGVRIAFSDERPYLVFDGGDNTYKSPYLHLKDGWIYTGDAVKSNNPKWRLKATKIK